MKKSVYFLMFVVIALITTLMSLKNLNQRIDVHGATVSGKLIEKNNNLAVNDALITVSDEGKVIAQTTVEKDGTFSVENLPNKMLDLSIENVAYTTVNKTIDLVNTTSFNFGNISLEMPVTVLEELIIFVKR